MTPAEQRTELVTFICRSGHGNQTRKTGGPYWTHPLAVSNISMATNLERYQLFVDSREDIRDVAILHDVLEDCKHVDPNLVKSIISEKPFNVLDALSRRPDDKKEDYWKRMMDWTERTRCPDVLIIKLADVFHNLSSLPIVLKGTSSKISPSDLRWHHKFLDDKRRIFPFVERFDFEIILEGKPLIERIQNMFHVVEGVIEEYLVIRKFNVEAA